MTVSQQDTKTLRVYDITRNSRANGPGSRTVIHLAGCTIHCKGCFSQHTWDSAAGEELEVDELLLNVIFDGTPDGVSISGGEPLEQSEGLLALLNKLDKLNLPKGLLLFSGTTATTRSRNPLWPAIKEKLDAAVLGPYKERQAVHPVVGLASSSNQLVETYTSKITPQELLACPSVEVKIGVSQLKISGFPRGLGGIA